MSGARAVYMSEAGNPDHLKIFKRLGLRPVFLQEKPENEEGERELLNRWFSSSQISIERPTAGIDAIRSFVAVVARSLFSGDPVSRFNFESARGMWKG